jgi:hypothetical protein
LEEGSGKGRQMSGHDFVTVAVFSHIFSPLWLLKVFDLAGRYLRVSSSISCTMWAGILILGDKIDERHRRAEELLNEALDSYASGGRARHRLHLGWLDTRNFSPTIPDYPKNLRSRSSVGPKNKNNRRAMVADNPEPRTPQCQSKLQHPQ